MNIKLANNETFQVTDSASHCLSVPAITANTFFATLDDIPDGLSSYDDTLSNLSSDGYATESWVSTYVPVDLSAFSNGPRYIQASALAQMFQDIQNPKNAVNSLADTMTSVLNILRSLQ